MALDSLISRLEQVKRTGAGRWMARCPAHEDKGPSLSIRELDDGRVLLKCFAGCDVEHVLGACGLTFADLYPERELQHGRPERRPFPAADVLRAIGFEALVVLFAATAMASGEPMTAVDRARLSLASSRIQAAIDAAGLGRG